jgi:hypothetical protein
MNVTKSDDARPESQAGRFPDRLDSAKPAAWELVESGRYRPRRIRGSLLGRELG